MTIFIPYNTAGSGGPSVFVAALSKHLKSRGHKVIHHFSPSFDMLLVIAECSLSLALYAKLTSKRIVQRLDGVYNLASNHRFYFLKNLRMQIIHNYLADHVIYQSQFARHSCHTMLGKRKNNTSIIYNGAYTSQQVNPNIEATGGAVERLPGRGTLSTECDCDRRPGMAPRRQDPSPLLQLTAFASFRRIDQIKPILESVKNLTIPYHLHIYGPCTKNLFPLLNSLKNNPHVTYHGSKKHSQLLIDIQHHDIFLFSDQSACPNAVLEALAAGLPVVAFNRGSLPELIQPGISGEVVDLPTHNPFRDAYPFTEKSYQRFTHAIIKIARYLPAYQQGTLKQARDKFNLQHVLSSYEKIFSQNAPSPR